MTETMTQPLNWDTFQDYCHETDGITVRETNSEKTYITIEDIEKTDPLLITELLVLAHDCNVHIGSFFAGQHNGEVTFTEY